MQLKESAHIPGSHIWSPDIPITYGELCSLKKCYINDPGYFDLFGKPHTSSIDEITFLKMTQSQAEGRNLKRKIKINKKKKTK